MTGAPRFPTSRRLSTAVAAGAIAAVALTSCAVTDALDITNANADSATDASTSFFDNSAVHEVDVEADAAELDAALAAYAEDGSKEWVSATVTIDGSVYENVGLRLKGNSSLRGVDADAEPTALPWLIRLDKYVDGQQHASRAEYVVRQNNTETSLNEALALALVGEAGLETEAAAAARFSVNGADAELRLVIDNPDDELWSEANFAGAGITYEAESDGDYSYRGEDGTDYAEAFTPKAGGDDLAPVAGFLDFVNNSTDEEFSADLGEHLDVDAFATYLAVQDLVGNTDDIDGPGNNSYLRYDAATGLMKVVSWDMNLAFGGVSGRGGGPGEGTGPGPGGQQGDASGGFEPPADGERTPPEGFELPQDSGDGAAGAGPGRGASGPGGGSNPLVERFLADEAFAAAYAGAQERLQEDLVESGAAERILSDWSGLLTAEAADLVDADTVAAEAEDIRQQLAEQ
ncbi:CotH kinase family protein [Zhihengliuella halotolerans]|uniref:CotH kinase family protein n=1 Tax=Zhihengliuella halotolerans TaxID=370736 RepID=UPI000C80CCF1|nr:CotH kinase family protein [Zhihengliuella halotolerans]